MRTYALENRGRAPLYEYLYRCIREDILDGTLTAGERLPSKRALAEHLHISVMTVEGAYAPAGGGGLCVHPSPSGAFLWRQVERPPACQPPLLRLLSAPEAPALAAGSEEQPGGHQPASPSATWARLTRQVLSEDGDALLRPVPHQGLPALRQAIARRPAGLQGHGCAAGADRGGGRGGVPVSAAGSAAGPGGRALPWRIRAIPRSARSTASAARLAARCPWTARALPPEALEAAGARVVHLSPAHHYPTGLVTPIGRRQALLRWAEKAGGVIIEDDYDSEFRFTGRPIPTLQSIDTGGRVVYMNTFSQTISPSMRVGFMVLPPRLLEQLPPGAGLLRLHRARPGPARAGPVPGPAATTSSTWPGCARSTAPVTSAVLAAFRSSPFAGTGSPSRSRGRGSTFSCGWTPGESDEALRRPGGGPGRPAGLSLGVRRHPLPCLRPHAGGELRRPQPGGAAGGHGPAGGDLRGLMPAVHSPAQKSRPPLGRPALCIGFSVHTPGFPSSAVMLFLKWTANMVAVVHTARKSATGSARKTAKALSAKKLGRI